MKGRILDRVVAAGREHRTVALATDIVTGRQLLLDGDAADGDLALDEAALAVMREALRADRNRSIETPAGRIFVEVFSPPRRCFVIGAVHVAQPLVQMLSLADYAVTVIDPRQSFATEARFPGVELTQEWPDEALERLRPDRASAVVTLTHDPKIDDPALAVALRSECFYIGALGSRRTHAARCARLERSRVSPSMTSPAFTPPSGCPSAGFRRPKWQYRSSPRWSGSCAAARARSRMRFGEVPVAEAAGAILAHSLRLGTIALKKGRVLSPADVELIAAAGLSAVVVARLGPGDVGEDDAARRVAAAAIGPGIWSPHRSPGAPISTPRRAIAGFRARAGRPAQPRRRSGDLGDVAAIYRGRTASG